MIAIETKYLGPTDYRGSRIKAYTVNGQSLTISYPHELSGEACHRKAAEELREKAGWSGELVSGSTKGGYAFVFIPQGVVCVVCHRPFTTLSGGVDGCTVHGIRAGVQ